MSAIKNVVVAGASGTIGTPVLKALVNSGKFNITVFTRIGSKSTFPAGTKTVEVDYESADSLTTALKGQDAVVSTLATSVATTQEIFIDAAIAAGVKRFIPSEFGSNLENELTSKLPVFAGKVQIKNYLIQKAKESSLSYTFIYNGAFLDSGLKHDFILKISDAKPNIFDGGDLPFSTTTLESVSQAVVGVLEHPEETKNRAVRVSDIITTQNKLLALAKKVAPEKNWELQQVKIDDLVAKSDERLKQHLYDFETFGPYLFRAIFDKRYGGTYEQNDNELLGVKGKTEADVENILKEINQG